MSTKNDFEVVLVTYKSREHVEELVAGWPEELPIAIVDNGQGIDGLDQWARKHPNVRYLDGGNVGFARAANKGAFTSSAPFVVFVNPDSRPTMSDMQALVDGLAVDVLAASHAATMVSTNGVEMGVGGWEPTVPRTIVYAAGLHKRFPKAGVYAKPEMGENVSVEWTTGACMAVRTEQFRRLEGFDESFYVYSEDMSFGRRAREAGLAEVLRSDVIVPHGAGNSGAPSKEMLRLRGASFTNYVKRYHTGPEAKVMRGAMLGGYALRAARELARGDRPLAKLYVEYAKGVATGRANVGGREVARSRFLETSPTARAAGVPGLPFLFVTKEFGIPATSGGMLRTLAMVRWFAERDDVILVTPKGVKKASGSGEHFTVEDIFTPKSGPFSRVEDATSFMRYRSLGALRLCGDAVIEGVQYALEQYGPFRGSIIDHTSLFAIADILPEGLPVWLSTHNVESDLMAQRAHAETGAMKVAAYAEAALLKTLEKGTGARHPMIVCTEHDAHQARKDGTSTVIVARNGVTPPPPEKRRGGSQAAKIDSLELLFTGALDWRPNINGILWLIESPQWADLISRHHGLVLTIAGRNPSEEFRARVQAAPGTRLEANVPSMAPLLERARLGIAPLLEGGGSRIKLLEYIGYGLPSVSTHVGASGLDGLPEGVIRTTSEDLSRFCEAIEIELLHGEKILPQDAVDAMLAVYGWDAALAPIEQLLEAAKPAHTDTTTA
ncbi:dTDP-Rha:alpha-D-GlcNAc-pyrophosphate polyprenol, alpha-3-L-rhamnosyltransferase [Dermatophilus congolensis]|uniref:dTDP-Rha:alpha-D-GlcNAc-pyrophosphate polyprenol, alpha-3-L-rhamnosyltransferase n=1 Tax=Dermatophilus congolensis TaxID=1863 RepID=A0A239VKG0_9MICO|nr:glycosyltransferase [Dermatophilus congolensis]SNV22356.1 dTDP-Rha:alpha-D-GlcNAc-pyrophosphate polyprenol, alpha-3-L-rhamnosyltransferase [Dermatophilus congolensis]